MIKILFLCVGNAARSQMAEGFARSISDGKIEAFSAGSNPAGLVDPLAIAVMKEQGIDISSARSKGFDGIPPGPIDYVVSMGCEKVCPFVPAKKYIEWDIHDPKGKTIDDFRAARDTIKRQLKNLLLSMGG
jgi:protein-tyrosine-phosphatase